MPTRNKTVDVESKGEDSRKARKRATDRRAQRDHRQRRKAYLKHLEESVQSLSQQHNTEDRVKCLLEENRQLKDNQARLHIKFNQIRALVLDNGDSSQEHQDNHHETQPVDDPTYLMTPSDDVVQNVSFDALHEIDSDQALDQENHEDTDAFAQLGINGWTDGQAQPVQSVGFGSPPSHAQETSEIEGYPQAQSVTSTEEIFPLDPSGVTAAETQTFNLCKPLSFHTDATPSQALVFESTHDLQGAYNCPDYMSFPRIGPAVGYSDRMLARFLAEARQDHLEGRFDESEPSLARLLSDPPHTTLAFRLFHFIAGSGPMPLHLFMGIFWVQYLVLRWMVLGTQSAYEKIPRFMRPTPLECIVPHRLFISMIAWPDIRAALIRDGETTDPEAVGIHMMSHLSQNWPGTVGTGLMASMDMPRIIEKQAESSTFWSLDSEFFVRYPQYSNCKIT